MNHLPHVLLIGDSISGGYTEPVRKLLEGRWEVLRPHDNCADTIKGLAHIDDWLGERRWDLVHFNWGLHDLCHRHPDAPLYGNRDKVNGPVSVEPDQYRTNIETLVARLERAADRLLWASTTIVPPDEAGRFEGDDLRYNAIAAEIMQTHAIPTNDLHSLTATFDASLFVAPGDVHFTEEGYAIIARQVARRIEEVGCSPVTERSNNGGDR